MAEETPVADDVADYVKSVQDRQDMRNEAAGVATPDNLPERLEVAEAAADGPTSVTITAPVGTEHHHLLTELIEHLKAFPTHVQITEHVGRGVEATATEEVAE